ncbi:MAG: hypothetical protein GY854_14830 [Deltaproteobacteria bacterium]|nr:hypothetical protein [Deltaproteobacteria bacterium]
MNVFTKKAIGAVLFLALGCGQEVKIVEVDPMNLSFTKKSQNRQIKAIAKDIHDAPVPGIPITFSSENQSVATVDSDGTIKPTGNGSTAILAKTSTGIQGEAFIKVCLPKDLICEPGDKLTLKVGTAGPIKCHVTNCRDEKLRGARIELTPGDRKMVLKEGDNVFIGLAEGDTEVSIKAGELEKKVAIHVDEQVFLPGMGPGSGGGGGGKRGGGGGKDDDPYGGSGRFDHILSNMKFKE